MQTWLLIRLPEESFSIESCNCMEADMDALWARIAAIFVPITVILVPF